MDTTYIDNPPTNTWLSPSSINSYIQCPSKFLMRYVLKLEVDVEPYKETEEGIKFHSWCESYYKPGVKHTYESFLSEFNTLNEQYAKNISKAQGLCLFENNIEYIETVAIELKLLSKDRKRIGYIDRIVRLPDGNYCIIDYKPNNKRRYPKDILLQIHFYIDMFNYLKNVDYNFKIFDSGLATCGMVLGYKDSSNWIIPYSNKELLKMEKTISKIKSSKYFPCFQGPLCNWCDFKDNYCEAYNRK